MKLYQKSLLIVAIQVVTMVYLLLTGPFVPADASLLVPWGAGILLGIWSYMSIKPNKLYIFPEVKPGNKMITGGPYAFIRHPMYLAELLFLGSLVAQMPSFMRIAVLVLLTLALVVKIQYEEASLTRQYSGYKSYKKKTARLIPLLY